MRLDQTYSSWASAAWQCQVTATFFWPWRLVYSISPLGEMSCVAPVRVGTGWQGSANAPGMPNSCSWAVNGLSLLSSRGIVAGARNPTGSVAVFS